MNGPIAKDSLSNVLNSYAGSRVPGLQYVVVGAGKTLYSYAGGWADIVGMRPMTLSTTMMAYSMSKTLTAVAVLQLVEQGKLGLEDKLDCYLPNTPYAGHGITVRQLLAHTSGLPNPIPIRWAHLLEEDQTFDEDAALEQVMHDNPKLASKPGQKYAYSNIGYWLLGKIVEKVARQPYTSYMRANVLERLGLEPSEVSFSIEDLEHHANGYLAKYSLMNLVKGFMMDRKFFGSYEGDWLRLKSHHLNGPAFGGLVGTAQEFAKFLQDQLRSESVLLDAKTKKLLETQQANTRGEPVPMTLGWHVGETQGIRYLFKEGGGGGFHGEMRLYPSVGIGTVVMVNATEFNSRQFLNRLDTAFLAE